MLQWARLFHFGTYWNRYRMALTNKQRVFIEEYLRTWNATAAARAAGYSENTAYATGAENLNKPEIAAAISERLRQRHMTADEALSRTADIARFDMTEWIDADGNLDIAALRAAGKGHVIKKLKTTRRTTVRNDVEYTTTTTEIEAYPADAAHDKLLRHHGQYNDRLAVDLNAQVATEIEIVRNADD